MGTEAAVLGSKVQGFRRVQGFKGSIGSEFMTVQDIKLDHVFVMCAAGAPEAEALCRWCSGGSWVNVRSFVPS